MANKKYQKAKPITVAIQKYNMRAMYKNIIVKDIQGTELKMVLKVQPTENSKFYFVLLEYNSLQAKPKAYISVEQLEMEDLQSIPHNYGIEYFYGKKYVSLCLNYTNEWNPMMSIVDTIVPWICEWLYFYEIWFITGKWCGGGKHPTKKDIKENNKN